MTEIQDIADFFLKYGEGLFKESQREDLERAVEGHIKYNTIKVIKDDEKIVAAVRWNWNEDNTVHILDLTIRPDYRNLGLVDRLAILCLKENPDIVGLHFENSRMTKRFFKEAEYYLGKEKGYEHKR